MARVSTWWRGPVLVATLLGGLIAFTWSRLNSATGCHFSENRDGSPAAPFDWVVAKATIPPVALLFVGAFIALGAHDRRWRIAGLALCGLALALGLLIGDKTYQACT